MRVFHWEIRLLFPEIYFEQRIPFLVNLIPILVNLIPFLVNSIPFLVNLIPFFVNLYLSVYMISCIDRSLLLVLICVWVAISVLFLSLSDLLYSDGCWTKYLHGSEYILRLFVATLKFHASKLFICLIYTIFLHC